MLTACLDIPSSAAISVCVIACLMVNGLRVCGGADPRAGQLVRISSRSVFEIVAGVPIVVSEGNDHDFTR